MKKLILITLICLVYAAAFYAQDTELPGRKEKKEVIRIFGEETDINHISLLQVNSSIQECNKEADRIFILKNKGKLSGYLLTSRAPGRFEFFDYSVIYSPDLSILNVTILVYRSANGTGICSKGWLKQFIGYGGGDLSLGKEIDAVSGGTISANSLIEDLERCYCLMNLVKGSGLLE